MASLSFLYIVIGSLLFVSCTHETEEREHRKKEAAVFSNDDIAWAEDHPDDPACHALLTFPESLAWLDTGKAEWMRGDDDCVLGLIHAITDEFEATGSDLYLKPLLTVTRNSDGYISEYIGATAEEMFQSNLPMLLKYIDAVDSLRPEKYNLPVWSIAMYLSSEEIDSGIANGLLKMKSSADSTRTLEFGEELRELQRTTPWD